MAKDKARKRKFNAKALIIIFAVLCVIVAAVVLAVTYWPAKATDVANSFTGYNQSMNEADSNNSAYKQNQAFLKFENKYVDDFINRGKTDYVNEMITYKNVVESMSIVSSFYSHNFEGILNSKISRKEAKEVGSALDSGRTNSQRMGDYLIEHEDEMANFTVVCASWESIRDYAQSAIQDYINASSAIENICNKELHGVYGNQKLRNVLKGTTEYLKVISDKLYNDKGFKDAGAANTLSGNMKSFVRSYYQDKTNLISNYYIDKTIREGAKTVSELEEKTEGKVNFYFLISNNFEYKSASLSAAQEEYVKAAVNFLHGGV